MMSPRQCIDEALGWFEAYRRLGFPSEHIHLAIYAAGDVFMELHSQGKVFRGGCGFYDGTAHPRDEVHALWISRATDWNSTMSESERAALYAQAFPAQNVEVFLLGLHRKGIVLPSFPETWGPPRGDA